MSLPNQLSHSHRLRGRGCVSVVHPINKAEDSILNKTYCVFLVQVLDSYSGITDDALARGFLSKDFRIGNSRAADNLTMKPNYATLAA